MSEVAAKVKAIIVDKLGVEEADVTQTASFTNDLGADSLDTVEPVSYTHLDVYKRQVCLRVEDEALKLCVTV